MAGPVQVVVMNITDRQDEFMKKVAQNLQEHHFRVDLDLRNEKIGFKIREHTLSRVPYLLVLGTGKWKMGRWPFAREAVKTLEV